MTDTPQQGRLVILATLCVALLLTIMPIPDWARHFRPAWVALILIYWAMALPHRVGIGVAFATGIMLDVISGTLLGQHALGLAVIIYITLHLHQRVRLFPAWQQSLVVLALLLLDHMLNLWVIGLTREHPPGLEYWIAPLVGMLLWPWVFVLLRDLRRRFQVS